MMSKVQNLLESDPEPPIRKLASNIIETMK